MPPSPITEATDAICSGDGVDAALADACDADLERREIDCGAGATLVGTG